MRRLEKKYSHYKKDRRRLDTKIIQATNLSNLSRQHMTQLRQLILGKYGPQGKVRLTCLEKNSRLLGRKLSDPPSKRLSRL